MRDAGRESPRCSFCLKPKESVKLISSPRRKNPEVYICSECIGVCVSILEDESEPEPAPVGAESADQAHPLLDHPLTSELLAAVERWVHEESLGCDNGDALAEVRRIAQVMLTVRRRA